MAENGVIELQKPVSADSISLEDAILKMRVVKKFSSEELSLQQLSKLLWAGQGLTLKQSGVNIGAAAASSTALYPIELYLTTKHGLYHYLPRAHKLEILSENDLRGELSFAALKEDFVSQAAVNIIICALFSGVTSKYSQRRGGIWHSYIEAEQIAQNIHLQAVALDLASVPVGSFNEEDVRKVICLPDSCEPLYIISVGYPE